MNTIKKYLESIRQFSLPGTRALLQELDAVRDAHTAVSAELAEVREKLQRTHEDGVQLLANLRQQVKQIESDRNDTRHQVELLESSLSHAEQRQKFTDAQVNSLETKLEEERNRHATSMHALEHSMVRMQDEQQSLLKLQSEQANAFHGVAMRLLGSMQKEDDKPQYTLLQLMTIAGVLFVTGSLAGVLTMQNLHDSSREFTVVEQNIRDMRGFMKQHIENQDALIKDLALKLNTQTFGEQALVGKETQALEPTAQVVDNQQQESVIFTPDIMELRTNLIALGYNLGMSKPDGEPGIKTRQALQEFQQFYLPHGDVQEGEISEPLVALILKSADLARADAARFGIRSDVLAAIRLGSLRTGVNFSFLMELARVESNFNPTARAPKSSATGLFQFKDNDWLAAIRTFGADYGLNDYATRVELIDGEEYEQQPIVHDTLQMEVLALRLNPRLSTLLAAENIKRNLQILSDKIGREPGRTDLYLSHYLGSAAAVLFLKTLDEKPAAIAGEIFPEAAARNRSVFQGQQLRTVAEVYQWFDSKFNIARYDERNPG